MKKLILVIAISLLNVGCATYSQAYHSRSGIVLYDVDTDPLELCKMYFNRSNNYPGTENYWDIEASNSTIFITGTYRKYNGDLHFKNMVCPFNYWIIDGVKYIGIKGVGTLHPLGPAIGWSNTSSQLSKGIYTLY